MIINFNPVVEELLQQQLKQYFKDIKFQEIFHKSLNINLTHPFAYFLDNEALNKKTLFPSLTIISEADQYLPQWTTAVPIAVDKEFLNMIKEDREKDADFRHFFLTDDDLNQLELSIEQSKNKRIELFKYSIQKSEKINFEIWCNDELLKNRIYDFVDNFLFGAGRFQYLNFPFIDIGDEPQGNRSGAYNNDFGELLFGCNLSCMVSYTKSQYVFAKDPIIPKDISEVVV